MTTTIERKTSKATAGSEKPETLRINAVLDAATTAEFAVIQEMSLLSGPIDVVRRALVVLSDMLWAQHKGYEIVLRRADGAEWRYSPHLPQRAIGIVKGPPSNLPVNNREKAHR